MYPAAIRAGRDRGWGRGWGQGHSLQSLLLRGVKHESVRTRPSEGGLYKPSHHPSPPPGPSAASRSRFINYAGHVPKERQAAEVAYRHCCKAVGPGLGGAAQVVGGAWERPRLAPTHQSPATTHKHATHVPEPP